MIYTGEPFPKPPLQKSIFEVCLAHEVSIEHKPAFVDAGIAKALTRSQLRADALRIAYGIRHLSQLGLGESLRRGDKIMLFSQNSIPYILIWFGALAAGTPIAPSNAALTPNEIAHQLKLTEPRLYAVHPNLLDVLLVALKTIGISEEVWRKRVVLLCEDSAVPAKLRQQKLKTISSFSDHGNSFEPEKFEGPDSKELAMVFYSSGTTSLPKAVEISHKNLSYLVACVDLNFALERDDIVLSFLPYFHIAGTAIVFLTSLFGGRTCIFSTWSGLNNLLHDVQKYRANALLCVPPQIAALGADPCITHYDLRSLKFLATGGAPISGWLMHRCHDRLKRIAHPDFRLKQIYGLSETTGFGLSWPRDYRGTDKFASVGRPTYEIEARVVNEDGKDVPQGHSGEIWLSGPLVMRGYFGNPNATRDTMDGRWFKTGDIAFVDKDGYFHIVDRQKELIKYQGYQVPPAEIEATLGSHPQIADAGVIGVMSADGSTELPRAYVKPNDPSLLKDPKFPTSIQKWIKGKVAYYKELRGGVIVVDNIPRTAAGKILRRDLRELAKRAASAESDKSKL
ncbi:uncharacterized protein EI90DRAFT_2905153 [Cantharellus anzutake]|uniref:uncharacterized protein n=1 Tax=Cantharellus anzutake TaxID=1750568 RepID=UPI001904A287|nr:uncharacterized protein EI90DRAFT_2905153 [Cantharellus anzutake]KAF8341395.1 hypothetical protein EI90DRAFT_2905153 [Cantharellus anzutake]